jgi:UDP-N-acetyl-D-glucosamine dehydrogenase
MSAQETAMRGHQRAIIKKSPLEAIAIVGLGYVGLPLAIAATQRGYPTVGFDIDKAKIARLKKREANFLSREEAEAFQRATQMCVTGDERDLDRANTFIICVPTPVHEDRQPDLGPLKSASEIVGRHLKRGGLVVVESTVNPGACEKVSLPILERVSGLPRDAFHFAHCPERINPGDPRWSVCTITRVIGGRNKESLERTVSLYRNLIDAEIVPMQSLKEAEAVKMVENSFRDINIAFVNELAMAFDRAGIDIVNVIRGASTKPFGFMPHYPGCGVGGHCIPVDPYYLIRYGAENGFDHRFLATARRINNGMPHYTVRLLRYELEQKGKRLHGATIALLGLAYKKDVPDLRESPALAIRDILVDHGAEVRTFDPYVSSAASAKSIHEALRGADAALLATDHTMFRSLSPKEFSNEGVGIVIDGRNCLDKDSFVNSAVTYRGIGRPSV